MKTTFIFIIVTLLFGQTTFCQTVISGKIDNYTGAENEILINPFFPENVGEINPEGEFKTTLDGSYIEKLNKQIEEIQKKGEGQITLSTLKDFQTRYQCEEEAFTFTNSELPYSPLMERIGFMVGNLENNKVEGVINLVNSKDFVESQFFIPRNDPTTGYMLDWYYVEESAKVNGNCNKRMSTGNGDETYDWEVDVDLDFHPGWNLVKYEISKIYTAKDGNKHVQKHRYSSLDKMPENVKYIYTKK